MAVSPLPRHVVPSVRLIDARAIRPRALEREAAVHAGSVRPVRVLPSTVPLKVRVNGIGLVIATFHDTFVHRSPCRSAMSVVFAFRVPALPVGDKPPACRQRERMMRARPSASPS